MTTIDSSSIHFGLETETSFSGASRKPDEAGGPNGFAEVFAGLQPRAPRLPTAAPMAADRLNEPDPLASPVMLQRVELSPAMQLIMPAAPTPDIASLQAFARSQGLDEQVIQQLLGDAPAAPVGVVTAPVAQSPSDGASALPPAAVALAGATYLGLLPQGVTLTSDSGAETSPSNMPLPGLLPPGLLRAAQGARPAGAASEPNAAGKTAWAQPIEVISLDLMGAEAPVDPQGLPSGGLLKGLDGGQAGMLRSWLLPKDTASPLNDAASNSSGLAVVSRAAGATTIMAGDLARLDPAATAAAESALAEDGAGFSASLLSQGLQAEPPVGNEVSSTAGRSLAVQDASALAARAPTEAGPPTLSSQERADQLAQKMGEAIAQRLMSRLEQGNWQFRFVLNPKNMGEVQVNLHMQGGGLDGSFVASQAATRDLLNDGLQRLRDTLSAAGMNVASLDVGAGHSSRQGQQSMTASVPQPSDGSRAQTQGAQEGQAAIRHRESLGGEHGWDVLV
ncbi:MAG: flagellar hook-length control protein FliK [Betaproteobacteria bacterium]|nr:flagellar hook-length control protein FliK [Betaproteobacteria bacterium]